jgi:poly(3-hydroxybutyrate) depolymerase
LFEGTSDGAPSRRVSGGGHGWRLRPARRVYATGRSNGAAFTYLLWTTRGKEFAAVAPSSAPGALVIATAKGLRPLPVLHLTGEKDENVPFVSQERVMKEQERRASSGLRAE